MIVKRILAALAVIGALGSGAATVVAAAVPAATAQAQADTAPDTYHWS